MRKLVVFLGVLALFLSAAGVGQVMAAPYGTDITINDQAPVFATSLPANEDGETEPGCLTGQGWDLEGFQQSGATLTIIGGFNFATGVVGGYQEDLGALFLKNTGAPGYGAASQPIGNLGTGDHNSLVANNMNWSYDYAILFNFGATNTYTLWQDNTGNYSAKVILHGWDGRAAGDVSNPWSISTATGDGWTQLGGTNTFNYYTGMLDGQTGYTGGLHNVITGIDLSFLCTAPGLNDLTWLHLTYDCGNDNLMGQVPPNSVPIPPSALLLGSGLVGLVGLGWRRKRTAG